MSAKPWSLSWAGEASDALRLGGRGAEPAAARAPVCRLRDVCAARASLRERSIRRARRPATAAAVVQDRETRRSARPRSPPARAGAARRPAAAAWLRPCDWRGRAAAAAAGGWTGARLDGSRLDGRLVSASGALERIDEAPSRSASVRPARAQGPAAARRPPPPAARASARWRAAGPARCGGGRSRPACRRRTAGHPSAPRTPRPRRRSGRWPAVAGSPSACSGEM